MPAVTLCNVSSLAGVEMADSLLGRVEDNEQIVVECEWSMMPKNGSRFSEKIVLEHKIQTMSRSTRSDRGLSDARECQQWP
jgi:hypothetical protein